ncbi:hypothetical protein TBLA_0H03210 [Henningerozyma blattae CBS 6284]|uniref:Deacetylase sirtuin-type domain-containing protein n=1 Tax=Henningerozyma blattae (strain ATCC 34711 / CBS 6284 / DSM 70876 / NBRC 10599 / NRRL Y-10934 / UCD 77-7) TaxID=1071380 RepID=I2H8A0_HENB6|nr:hypothetical protein TBLA_0H03210 [Tetrapisispora blattae CBS 6284]CCH62602.1 hypothetical protein TBLA_0H03210 [Tetrapisispora blattae CBS 6284]
MTSASNNTPEKKHALPLTPPSTAEKLKQTDKNLSQINDSFYTRRKLLPTLLEDNNNEDKSTTIIPSKRKIVRKPRLKYRPINNTVLEIDTDILSFVKPSQKNELDFLKYSFKYCKNMIVVTGAGISVASGIPDFRSSEGIFKTISTNGKDLFDYNFVYSNDANILKFNKMLNSLHQLSNKSKPSKFHYFLNDLSSMGKLKRLYTQNIDCLDTNLDHLNTSFPLSIKNCPKTIQLHGSLNDVICNKCDYKIAYNPCLFPQIIEEANALVPECPQCQEYENVRVVAGIRSKGIGKLRPRVILYNEFHPEGDIIGSITSLDLKSRLDCLVIVGTSMKIPGVKSMCKEFAKRVRKSKGYILFINKEMPSKQILDYIGGVDLIVLGDCQILPDLLADQLS